MRTFTAILMVLATILPIAEAADTVTVATFNCEFLVHSKVHIKYGLDYTLRGEEKTRWDQPGYRDGKLREAAREIASHLRTIDADVLVLTEVGDEDDVGALRAALQAIGTDYRYVSVCDSSDTSTGQHVAVLSHRALTTHYDAIPGREHYYEELDDPDSESNTGISKAMHVSFEADGETVHVLAAHLASERGGHEQDQQRIAQASILRRHYLPYLERGDHVIVAGDLNDHRGQPTLRRLRGLDDIFPDLIQTGHHDFGDDERARWTYEFRGNRNQIDHVLVSRSIYDACGKSGIRPRFVPTPDGVSDHRAVAVTLAFR